MLSVVVVLLAAEQPLPAFTEVLVKGPADVDVVVADKPSALVAGARVRVESGTLVVESAAGATVRVSGPAPKRVRATGAGHVRVFGPSGTGARKLAVVESGGGDVMLTGAFTALDLVVTGGGRIDAVGAAAKAASARVDGTGGIDVRADEVTAAVNGAGRIRYGGAPRKLDRKIAGGGTVEPLDSGTRARDERTPTKGAEDDASRNVGQLAPHF